MRCEKIGGVEAARRRVEIKCEKIRGIARTKGKSGSCRRIYVVPVIAFDRRACRARRLLTMRKP